MPTPSLPALFVLAGLTSHGAAAANAPTPPLDTAQAQLRAIHHRFIHAGVDASGDLIDALTHPDFVLLQADGQWQPRAHFVAKVHAQPHLEQASLEDLQVRLFGPVAVVHGLFLVPSPTSPTGTPTRLRFTDVHRWNGAAWQLLSVQETTVKESVALPMVRGSVPDHAPWHGQDPVGDDDVAQLHALNDLYVNAFRQADVGWYDAHLTPDYVVISGDGSLHDKASALARFAQPTFANTMATFPVGQVQVRRFDDIALIHAENAYELKDGRRGVSRYTDIWHHRRDDTGSTRWRCIAAHITVYRVPS